MKILFGVVLLIASCVAFALSTGKIVINPTDVKKTTVISSISYLVSTQGDIKYCNGDKMDDVGFRKTITKLVTVKIPPESLTKEELIKKTIILASQAANLDTIVNSDTNFLKIRGNTAFIKPIDGWAGISIFMCAWRPLVEVNLLRFSEIKKVEWGALVDQKSFDDWEKL